MTSVHPIRVFIADDHAALREGVRAILEHKGFQIAGEAGNVEDILAHVGDPHIDVWVLDLSMGETRGTAVIDLMRNRKKDLKIVVYTMRESLATVSAVYEAGAKAFVAKSAEPRILVEAIRTVAEGQTYFMPGFAEKLALYHTSGAKLDPRQVLTQRELVIFTMLAEGRTPSEIAEKLGLSSKSVSNRAFTIRHKLGIDRSDFLRLALEYHLIGEP